MNHKQQWSKIRTYWLKLHSTIYNPSYFGGFMGKPPSSCFLSELRWWIENQAKVWGRSHVWFDQLRNSWEKIQQEYTSCKIPWAIRQRIYYVRHAILSWVSILNASSVRTRFRLWYLTKTINMVKVDYFTEYFTKQNSFPFICPVLDFGI